MPGILDRLGVITDEVSHDLSEALDWAKEQGLKHVEVRMVGGKNIADMNDEEVRNLHEEVIKRGLFVSAIASPIFKCALDPERTVANGDRFGQDDESVDAHHNKLLRVIQIAAMLQTNRIRIFSFWRERDPEIYEDEIIKHLTGAAQIAALHNVQLLLENEPSCNGGFAQEVGRLVRRVNSAALKALWDPGNEQYGRRSAFPEGYESIRNGLAHVHLKDVIAENGESKAVPIGSGLVPYAEQFRALIADGYSGLYTIETHYIPDGGSAKDGTFMSLQGLRKLLTDMGLA